MYLRASTVGEVWDSISLKYFFTWDFYLFLAARRRCRRSYPSSTWLGLRRHRTAVDMALRERFPVARSPRDASPRTSLTAALQAAQHLTPQLVVAHAGDDGGGAAQA